jgi:hypothetical protein
MVIIITYLRVKEKAKMAIILLFSPLLVIISPGN